MLPSQVVPEKHYTAQVVDPSAPNHKALEENAYVPNDAVDMRDQNSGFQAKQIQNNMAGANPNNRMRPQSAKTMPTAAEQQAYLQM